MHDMQVQVVHIQMPPLQDIPPGAPGGRSPLRSKRPRRWSRWCGRRCRWWSGSCRRARRWWRSQPRCRRRPGSHSSWSWSGCSRRRRHTHRRKAGGAASPQRTWQRERGRGEGRRIGELSRQRPKQPNWELGAEKNTHFRKKICKLNSHLWAASSVASVVRRRNWKLTN